MWWISRGKMLTGEIKIFCPNKVMVIATKNGKVKVFKKEDKKSNTSYIIQNVVSRWL